jgi:hypothetical protein
MADVLPKRRNRSCSQHARVASGIAALLWGVLGCADVLDIPRHPHVVAEAVLPNAGGEGSVDRACGADAGCSDPAGEAPCGPDAGCSTAEAAATCSNEGCIRLACDAGNPSAACVVPFVGSAACTSDAECPDRVCELAACVPARCDDGRKNRSETDVDCGGDCPSRCDIQQTCATDDDCVADLFCAEQTLRCTASTCNDGQQNGREILVDCGGGGCPGCTTGTFCTNALDCASGLCASAGCRAETQTCCQTACRNGVVDADESDVDCGGLDLACTRCVEGQGCRGAGDCATASCSDGRCVACNDGVRGGNETDVDCGGSCPTCEVGRGCELDSDCATGACEAGRCCGGNQADCTRCARRLARGNSCALLADPTSRQNCTDFLQCLADNVATCPRRLAMGCSNDPNSVCNNQNFGGNGSPGIVQADRILGSAGCAF